ncbi:MAG: flagellar protein D [Thermoproteota archaeon]|nr:MAG: flagellar protein D [Candidatus Korarchaeota archaeon]
MGEGGYITEADINAKLSELRGKVPSVVINDLREKLMAKRDNLTYDQLEKIIQRVLDIYGSQSTKYEQISKRVDELGNRLGELSAQLSRLVESLEEAKFNIHEKRAELLEEKVGNIKEKIEILDEKLEGSEKDKKVVEVLEEIPEKIEELQEKIEQVVEKSEEEKAPEDIKPGEVAIEEVNKEVPAREEVVEIEELPQGEVEKIETAESPAGVVEGGEVEMAEKKFEVPEDIASLLFVEEPKKARLETLPEDLVSTMIALKWLGFLIDRVGIQNLESVLEFYYDIGWISEKVLNALLRYAKGTRPHHRDPEWKPSEKLTVQDHLISLLFIERLRGLRITRDVLDKLEREVKILEKTLDEFYGV